MTWNQVTTSETSWNAGNGLGQPVIYDAPFSYDADFINFGGYLIEANIDYATVSNPETSWRTE